LARRRQSAKLMLIGTYRPVDLTLAAHPLKPLKQDLLVHHLCREIALPPLEEDEVAEYLAGELGGAAVPDGLAGLIYGRSEGNPLFMVAILQHLREQRLLAEQTGEVRLTRPLEEVAFGAPDTLRQMIDSNQRLVLLAENHAGAAPWYHLAYQSITEETPYAFKKVSQLTDPAQLATSCRPNRGPEGAPLFLVNHWITTDPLPLPSNAVKVNAYGPLLARLRKCQQVRDHMPNLVAVNFYRRGDLFRAVDALNDVP